MLGRVLKDCKWREGYFFLPVLEAGGEVTVRWELVPSAGTGSLAQARSEEHTSELQSP